MKVHNKFAALALLAALLVIFPLLGPSSFAYDLAIRIAINAVVVIGLNLLFGYTGQISLGHAAFFGTGGYASAVLTSHFGWPPLVALLAGAAAVGLISFIIATRILRLAGHHLAMATMAIGFIATMVFNNEDRWTGGSDGMSVPALSVLGYTVDNERVWYALVATLLFLATCAALNLVNSPAGRAMQAIRGSEIAARLSGVDTARLKTRVFVLSAVIASVMGSLMAHYTAFITPSAAGLVRSVEFLMMVVLGGTASVFGSLVGSALVTLLPQVLHTFDSWETLVLGILLTAALVFMPRGVGPTLHRWVSRRLMGRRRTATR